MRGRERKRVEVLGCSHPDLFLFGIHSCFYSCFYFTPSHWKEIPAQGNKFSFLDLYPQLLASLCESVLPPLAHSLFKCSSMALYPFATGLQDFGWPCFFLSYLHYSSGPQWAGSHCFSLCISSSLMSFPSEGFEDRSLSDQNAHPCFFVCFSFLCFRKETKAIFSGILSWTSLYNPALLSLLSYYSGHFIYDTYNFNFSCLLIYFCDTSSQPKR